MIVTILFAYPLLALLVCASPQMPDIEAGGGATTGPAATAKAPRKSTVRNPAAPPVELKQIFTGSPEAIAGQLSTLLGVQVRLPRDLSMTLTLPIGACSSDLLLDAVARQVMVAKQWQGAWRRVFVFKPVVSHSSTPVCRLKSAGKVTLDISDLRFEKLAQTIARAAGCSVEMQQNVEGRFSLQCNDLAVERALADLAAQAHLSVSSALEFVFDTQDRANSMDEKTAEQLMQQEQGSQETLAELERLNAIYQATGLDPLDPDSNWNSVGAAVWAQLGFSPEAAAEMEQWMASLRENRSLTEELSWQMLSGALGEIGNAD